MTFLVFNPILSVFACLYWYTPYIMTVFLTKFLYYTPFFTQFVLSHASNNTSRNIGGLMHGPSPTSNLSLRPCISQRINMNLPNKWMNKWLYTKPDHSTLFYWTRNVHPLNQLCIFNFPFISTEVIKFSSYFRKIYKFPLSSLTLRVFFV